METNKTIKVSEVKTRLAFRLSEMQKDCSMQTV